MTNAFPGFPAPRARQASALAGKSGAGVPPIPTRHFDAIFANSVPTLTASDPPPVSLPAPGRPWRRFDPPTAVGLVKAGMDTPAAVGLDGAGMDTPAAVDLAGAGTDTPLTAFVRARAHRVEAAAVAVALAALAAFVVPLLAR